MQIVITERPGVCRWCGCTERNACDDGLAGGCSWANRAATLCSACVVFDREMRTAAGRRRIVAACRAGDVIAPRRR
jgi:hypothetical protein